MKSIAGTLAAPFPWFGGKSLACEAVWAAFGTVDNYVEPFCGSAANAGLSFIGIEREPKYFDIACRRIEQAYKQRPLFDAEPPKAPQQLGLEAA